MENQSGAIIGIDCHGTLNKPEDAAKKGLKSARRKKGAQLTRSEIRASRNRAYVNPKYVCRYVMESPGATDIIRKLEAEGHHVFMVTKSDAAAHDATLHWMIRKSLRDLPNIATGRHRPKADILKLFPHFDYFLENDTEDACGLLPYVTHVCLLTDDRNLDFDANGHRLIRVESFDEFYDFFERTWMEHLQSQIA